MTGAGEECVSVVEVKRNIAFSLKKEMMRIMFKGFEGRNK
jgi:hypothetical protein